MIVVTRDVVNFTTPKSPHLYPVVHLPYSSKVKEGKRLLVVPGFPQTKVHQRYNTSIHGQAKTPHCTISRGLGSFPFWHRVTHLFPLECNTLTKWGKTHVTPGENTSIKWGRTHGKRRAKAFQRKHVCNAVLEGKRPQPSRELKLRCPCSKAEP